MWHIRKPAKKKSKEISEQVSLLFQKKTFVILFAKRMRMKKIFSSLCSMS